jgi:hypothetical protein
MADLVPHIGQALLMAVGMFWQVGWSLVLGFGISAILQAVVSKESMTAALGRDCARSPSRRRQVPRVQAVPMPRLRLAAPYSRRERSSGAQA